MALLCPVPNLWDYLARPARSGAADYGVDKDGGRGY